MSTTATFFTLRPRSILRVLGIAIVLLVAAHVGAQLASALHPEAARLLVRLFDLDREFNLPSAFSSALFGFNALLFHASWRASLTAGESERFWLTMAIVMAFLGLDELGSFHERLVPPMREILVHTYGGLLRFAWVVPYSLVAAFLATLAIPVVRRLGARLGSLFALAGLVYLTGALGLEMLAGRYMEVTGADVASAAGTGFVILSTCEETLEMTGLTLSIYALLAMLQEKYGGFEIILPAAQRLPPLVAVVPVRLDATTTRLPLLHWMRGRSIASGVQPKGGSSKMT